jgi:hypothetical protein
LTVIYVFMKANVILAAAIDVLMTVICGPVEAIDGFLNAIGMLANAID